MSHSLLQPSDRYKLLQPPQNATSSTSLLGLEQAIAPQSKVKKPSIPADQWKPLPPPPSMTRRGSYGSSRSPFELDRRASSVYSDVEAVWNNAAILPIQASEDMPGREDFYKANRKHVRASMSEPQLLLPRTYRPLLATPSPTASPEYSPSPSSPPVVQRPSELLPLPPASTRVPPKYLHTISLTKAQAMVEKSQHLLPEELRAQKLVKSRSSEHISEPSHLDASRPQKPGSAFKPHESPVLRLPSVMMLDAQTWHTFDPSKQKLAVPIRTQARPATASSQSGGRHTPRKASHDARYTDEDERGRSRFRTPKQAVHGHKAKTSEEIAAEYATMLRQPHDDTIHTDSGYQDYDAQGLGISTAAQTYHQATKPLASNHTAAAYLQSTRQHSPSVSVSPKHIIRRDPSAVPSDFTIDSRPNSPPPPLFAFPESEENDRPAKKSESRTGSIPISPPSATQLADEPVLDRPPLPPSPTLPSPPPPEVVAALAQFKAETQMDAKAKGKARESAYYPYVGRRRHGKDKVVKPRAQQASPAGLVHSPSPASNSSSQKSRRSRKGSDVPELISRAVHRAASVADRLVRHSDTRPVISNPVQKDSSHLYPQSPANLGQSVTAVYLGWSEESKEDFDASKPVSPKHHYAANTFSPKPTVKPLYEHTAAPARPLDERNMHSQTDQPTVRGRLSRSGSIFGSLLELRKEKGRERRREEIKKTIRVLPNEISGASVIRPALVEKSASDADVPSDRPVLKEPRMGLWGRRISEFGMI